MANEAVVIELYGNNDAGDVVRYKCANGLPIPKGTICAISGSGIRECRISNAGGNIFAGIASTEKVANDGQTSIGLWTNGLFDLKCQTNDSYLVGQLVCISGANLVGLCPDENVTLSGSAFGRALETGASATVNAVRVLV